MAPDGLTAGQFEVLRSPGPDEVALLASRHGENPFFTPAYLHAQRRRGETVLLRAGPGECPALLRAGRWSRVVEVDSAPDDAGDAFWTGFADWCRTERVDDVQVGTFCTRRTLPSTLPGEVRRRERLEYVLALEASRIVEGFSSHHRRQARRGEKSGLDIEESGDPGAVASHVALMIASGDRRRARGESLRGRAELERSCRDLVESGAGTLWRAFRAGEVLSSMLILRAERGAYYHTAGTSSDGMECGASHFLMARLAERLADAGVRELNLGGVDPAQEGLRRFKTGFGSREIALASAALSFEPRLRRQLRALARGALGRLGLR